MPSKKTKRTIFFFLCAITAVVVYLVEIQKPVLTPEQKAKLNAIVLAEPLVKSHVWNESRLSVGVLIEQVADRDAFARGICTQFDTTGALGVSVDVVDVLKLQKSGGDDWDVIGYAQCQRK
ncbi:MAG: hypothetical protein V7752_00710 [Halopseudomonas sp.]